MKEKIQKLSESPLPPGGTEILSDEQKNADRLLCIALDIGEHMLRCGGEINRVETTIERICRSYGASHVEVFSITSLITAAIRMPDGTYSSQIRRIYGSSNNLYRLERFNAISRKVCAETPALDEVDRLISEAKRARPYPDALVFLGTTIATGSFAIFFGGPWRDCIAASLIGVIFALIERFSIGYINRMARTVIHSLVAGILSCLTVMIGLGVNLDKIMIATIMLLIPGLDFGNALRDLLCGDIVSGMLRSVQAVLVATMIAVGYSVALLLMGGWLA